MLILRLWRDQLGKFFCISTKSAAKKWHDEFFTRDEFDEVEDYIRDNNDKDIYFCPHGFNEARRKEEYAVMPNLMWADLDEANPRESKIKPTIAIESSPGRYVGLWMIDKPLDRKQTNQRLTYFLGADKGGWDITQVLRVPGTTNYKYTSTPRVRTLWIDGPTYRLRDIERQLPELEEDEEGDNDAQSIYEKYEKAFPHWVRRELLNGKPTPGKRSEMMWKLVNELIETGVSQDDCFILLKASPWNKFKGRDHQLKREIEKSTKKKFTGKKKQPERVNGYKFLTLPMSDVQEEDIDWVWYPYLARGELSILEGDPNVGKSYVAQMTSIAVVDGKRLPSVKQLPRVQGKVAYFDMENSAGSVTKKRLIQNGCRNLDDFYQEEEPFSIDNDEKLEEVYDAIEKMKPTLVVFDTLNTYIGKADIHKSSESQQAFTRFRDIAKRFNCSVMVLRHLTKGSRDRALYRGQGSIAFAGLARVVMTVGSMPDDPDTRVMAVTKLNVAKPPKALTFTITELPDTLKSKDRSKFEWGDFVDVTSDDLVAAPTQGRMASDRDDAKAWLKDLLSDGGVDVSKIKTKAETKSIGWRTLERAADELGVKRKVRGFGSDKTSIWTLRVAQ